MLTRSSPRTGHFLGLCPHGFHRVVYYEWGAPDNPAVVVCVHGVGRNGRDFDVIGEALSTTHRVLAVDMPGRGASDWLADPMDYVFPTYLGTLTALIAASGVERVSWVGTSMGGLLGIIAAAQPKSPVARLVVNDVGPAIEPTALARIGQYFGADPVFATFGELEAYV
ncbi:MAG TPA: alpha/beta hydrolase, partial [Casimicrobiaceae bacterium]|nr:alpha/beta hydrolase [Casimicrobiaceae bacterium]